MAALETLAYPSKGRYAAYSLIQVAGEERSDNARCKCRARAWVLNLIAMCSDHEKLGIGYKDFLGSLWQVQPFLRQSLHLISLGAASKDQEEAREIMGIAAEVRIERDVVGSY